VKVTLSAAVVEAQKAKVVSRYKIPPRLLALIHPKFSPRAGKALQMLQEVAPGPQFERLLDGLNRGLRASNALYHRGYATVTGRRLIAALLTLAGKYQQPPSTRDITRYLECTPAQTTKMCRDHGFRWLPHAPGGRPARRRR
jgi:hypothetical protein